jgi:hypothetical protein
LGDLLPGHSLGLEEIKKSLTRDAKPFVGTCPCDGGRVIRRSSVPQAWKTIRVFISSTFQDMHSERDFLVRLVFPELRERCAARQLHLVDVDLRWGVTEEEAQQGKVLAICLEEVERCRPFFIGILGQRYGRVTQKYDVPDEPQYDWVRQFQPGHSTTAMEIYHGVLNNRAAPMRAFFYFRDPAFLSDVPEAFRSDFLPESTESAQQLRQLKDEIRAQCQVFENYPCRYAAAGKDSNVMLTDLEALGERVLEDLWSAIEQEYRGDLNPPDDLAIERSYHERFMDRHSQHFIGRRGLLNELTEYADWDYRIPLTVTGVSGCGKSALLAAFAREYTANHPSTFVLSHFIGVSPGSTDIRRTLLRMCREMARHFNITDEIPQDYYELRQAFAKFLDKATSSGKLLLILDALNQLDKGHYARTLDWLPLALPRGLRFIVSTPDGDCLNALHLRDPVRNEITVGPLADEERKEIVRNTLWIFRKRLEEITTNDQMGLLLNKDELHSPLYLMVACEEMRIYGDFERVTSRIRTLPNDVAALFEQVLERLDRDHGRQLVCSALSLLECSRHGLLETEMLELLARSGEVQLPLAIWVRLYRALQFYLRPPGDTSEGVLDFFHDQLAEATRERYLPDEATKATIHALLARHFRSKADPRGGRQWTGNPRGLSELPYHLLTAKLYDELFQVASENSFLEAQASGFTDDPELPLETLRTAIEGAARINDAARMSGFVLAHARRLEAIRSESPIDALRAGHLKRSWELADLQDIAPCVLWHLLLAWELKDAGKLDAARLTLDRLRKQPLPRLSGANEDNVAILLNQISGVSDETLRVLRTEVLSDQGRERLCSYLIGDKRLAAAVETAQQIDHELNKIKALCEIAVAQELSGKEWDAHATMATAVDKAARIGNQILYEKPEALNAIAVAQARAGNFQAAFATAEEMDSPAITLSEIALAQLHDGKNKAARATLAAAIREADKIEDHGEKAEALSAIAAAQLRVGAQAVALGNLAAAIMTADEVSDFWAKALALNKFAAAQAQVGNRDGARKLFESAIGTALQMGDGMNRGMVLSAIATTQADAGELVDAFTTAGKIRVSTSRAEAMSGIFAAQVRAGTHKVARETLAGAVKITARVDQSSIAEALSVIAAVQAQSEEIAAAMETASQINDESSQARALSAIAKAQAKTHDFPAASETARTISDETIKTRSLINILTEQATAEQGDAARRYLMRAIETAQQMRDPGLGLRSVTLSTIAAARWQSGDQEGARLTFVAAIEAAKGMKDGSDRTEALSAIATAQAQSGEREAARATFAAAINTAKSMRDKDDTVIPLCWLALAAERSTELEASRTALATAIGIATRSEEQWRKASSLGMIAAAQARVGERDAAHATLAAAISVGERVDFKIRDVTLGPIALAQAELGENAAAIETVNRISNEKTKAKVLGGIAAVQARNGCSERALQTIQAILVDRALQLPQIVQVLVEAKDKEGLKLFLLPCAGYPEVAYKICGMLARVFPEQATAIARVVTAHSPFGSPE